MISTSLARKKAVEPSGEGAYETKPKNETQKTAAVFLSTFCFRKCWSKACLGKSRVLSHQGYCVQLFNEGWFVVGQAAAWARGARCVGVASSGGVRPSLHNGTCSG